MQEATSLKESPLRGNGSSLSLQLGLYILSSFLTFCASGGPQIHPVIVNESMLTPASSLKPG